MESKNKRKGLFATILVHGILLVIFIIVGLSVPLPLPAERGVIIDFGYTDAGSGDPVIEETEQPSEKPVEEVIETSTEVQEQEVLIDESSEIPVVDKKIEKPVEEPSEVKETEKPEKEEPQRKVDPRAIYKGSTKSDGTTSKAGDQGVEDGEQSNDYEGDFGNSDISLDLAGRSFVGRPKIKDNSQVEGKVVVTITVDKSGNITTAKAGARGTTIKETALWAKCENALKGVKLNELSSAPDIQKGTVTFVFKLR